MQKTCLQHQYARESFEMEVFVSLRASSTDRYVRECGILPCSVGTSVRRDDCLRLCWLQGKFNVIAQKATRNKSASVRFQFSACRFRYGLCLQCRAHSTNKAGNEISTIGETKTRKKRKRFK